MYGDRDDPAGVLARLGDRMQAVMLPDDVLPAVVETVAQSLRLPYVAIDLADATGEFRLAAEHGAPVGAVHAETLTHHGAAVGRLRVSERGRDDPLEPADLELVRSLAREVGPAVQAVRLHQDLLRSRAEVVALREDERRRLRRDLHDGLGPALAAIGLKAGLAARQVPPESAARGLLGEIDSEVKASLGDIRRLVEALRPPALDELGLVGAVRSRAAALAGDVIDRRRRVRSDRPAAGGRRDRRLPDRGRGHDQRGAAQRRHAAARCRSWSMTRRSSCRCATTVGVWTPTERPGSGCARCRSGRPRWAARCRYGRDEVGTVVSARLPLELGGPS